MEIIKSITRVVDQTIEGDWGQFDGFKIITDKQEISLLINEDFAGNEDYGYLLSEDVLDLFIGKELFTIEIVDKALKNYDISALDYLDMGDVVFVNLVTSVGVLQFVAYNAHNGYYGHQVKVLSKALEYDVVI